MHPRLKETKYCYFIENFFPEKIVAGFTKPALKGELPSGFSFLLSFLGIEAGFSYMNQKHGSKVLEVSSPGVYEADGLLTSAKNHFLIVKSADCLPLFLAGPGGRIGIIHMGWRSARSRILKNIGFDLSGFKAAAGVSLRSCCFQVGAEFKGYPLFSSYLRETEKRIFFDPLKFAKDNLKALGLAEPDFFDAGLCSFCSKQGFFSYRRDKTFFRILSFIAIT